jgi:coenzyme F420-reducing hydrogenase alpha subunit
MKNKLLQIIDANFNRAREGLRVCEDIARFAIQDKELSKALKTIRHNITKAILCSKTASLSALVARRNTRADAVKFTDFKTKKKVSLTDLFIANIQRAKESLRVLEECCKIIDEGASPKFRRFRFNVYNVEQKYIKKTRAMPCNKFN